MNEISLKPVIEELENLFSKFNNTFFEGKLEKPVITVSPDHTRGAYGWCTGWKAWQDGAKEGGYYEINLCAEYLNRPFEETCSTMIHEMVHLQNLQDGVQDTSRSGLYHNRKFRDAAEAHGLIVEKGDKYGWHKTTLNPEALAFVQSLGKDGFSLVRPKVNSLKGSKSGGGFQFPEVCLPLLSEPGAGATVYKAQRGCLEICCENDWYNHNGRIRLTITDGIGGNQIRMYFHPDTLNRDFVAEDAEKADDCREARVQWVGEIGKELAHKLVDQYWEG